MLHICQVWQHESKCIVCLSFLLIWLRCVLCNLNCILVLNKYLIWIILWIAASVTLNQTVCKMLKQLMLTCTNLYILFCKRVFYWIAKKYEAIIESVYTNNHVSVFFSVHILMFYFRWVIRKQLLFVDKIHV